MKSSLNLSYHLAIPLIPIYQREMKVRVHKKNNVRTFIGALFKIILNWKEPEKPIPSIENEKTYYVIFTQQ